MKISRTGYQPSYRFSRRKGGFMVTSSRTFRAFFFVVSMTLCLASTAASQDKPAVAPDAVRITLAEAQARAVATRAAGVARLNADAARYHRLAAQADYFPKVGATFFNLHHNKFMGKTIELFPRGTLLPTLARAFPLVNKDQTFVAVTVTQPLTPLFKVHQAVQIAKADERSAEVKASLSAAQVAMNVEQTYFALLIAQRRQTEAETKVEMAERLAQIASAGG